MVILALLALAATTACDKGVTLFLPVLAKYVTFFNLLKYLPVPKKFPVPIICVGNIYLGGTAKTPLVLEIFKITKLLGKNPTFIKKYYDYLKDETAMLKKIGRIFVYKNRTEPKESLIENKND